MKQLVFASNNAHKLSEIRRIVGSRFEILSLADIGCHDDIPETAPTLEGNALIKARWVKERYGYDCFADDTGLMVDALDGAPGVLTARFAGEHCTPADNVALLLEKLQGNPLRTARFSTVIALILNGKEYVMTGTVEGEISTEERGADGFGYDPIFIPENTGLTFAQMGPDAKNAISHRGRATEKLLAKLEELSRPQPPQPPVPPVPPTPHAKRTHPSAPVPPGGTPPAAAEPVRTENKPLLITGNLLLFFSFIYFIANFNNDGYGVATAIGLIGLLLGLKGIPGSVKQEGKPAPAVKQGLLSSIYRIEAVVAIVMACVGAIFIDGNLNELCQRFETAAIWLGVLMAISVLAVAFYFIKGRFAKKSAPAEC